MSSHALTRGGARNGILAAVAAAAVLAWTSILIRHLTVRYHVPPLVLAFWRNALVVATLLPSLAIVSPRRLCVSRSGWLLLAALGLVLAAFNALWTFSVARVGAAAATVLVYSSGAMTAVLGALFLRERLDRWQAVAAAACFAGCVLVAGPRGGAWPPDLAGAGAGLLSGLAYAVYSIVGRAGAKGGLDPWTIVLGAFGFAAIFLGAAQLGAAALQAHGPALESLAEPARDPAAMGWLFLLAAGPTVIGFGLYGVSLARLPAGVANLILTLEPAMTGLIAWALLGEQLGAAGWCGSGVVLLGVAALRLRDEGASGVRSLLARRGEPPAARDASAAPSRAPRGISSADRSDGTGSRSSGWETPAGA